MTRLPIANTGIMCSRIAFGTASLHQLFSKSHRERLLWAALDAGISHFDTSPYYGFGLAESTLAALARASVTVATKVGLYSPGAAQASFAQVLGRKLLGRVLPSFSRPIADLSVARARESLLGSLRRMRRERIDLLLLHEPRVELLDSEEWLRWLDTERDRIGAVGVAGEPARVLPFVERAHPLAAVIQTRDSIRRQEAQSIRRAGRRPQFTFGHVTALDDTTSACEALRLTSVRLPDTVLVMSTRQPGRIADWARCVQES